MDIQKVKTINCNQGNEGNNLPSLVCVIADNTPSVIPTLLRYLERCGKGYIKDVIVHIASNCKDAVDLILKHNPDLAILDHNMPYSSDKGEKGEYNNGAEILEYLNNKILNTCVTIFTGHPGVLNRNLGQYKYFVGSIFKNSNKANIRNQITGLIKTVANISEIKQKNNGDVFVNMQNVIDIETEKILYTIENIITNVGLEKNNIEFSDKELLLKKLKMLGENAIPGIGKFIIEEKNVGKKSKFMGVLVKLITEYDVLTKEYEEIISQDTEYNEKNGEYIPSEINLGVSISKPKGEKKTKNFYSIFKDEK